VEGKALSVVGGQLSVVCAGQSTSLKTLRSGPAKTKTTDDGQLTTD
jgi:hypothetical protein